MKQIQKKKIFSNQVFDVFKNNFALSNKQVVKDYLSIQPNKKYNQSGGIMIIPIKNHKIGLMKVYYPIIKKYLYSLPQGFCDKGETLSVAAIRELNEETGFVISKKDIKPLSKFYPNPSMINSKISIYITNDLIGKKKSKQKLPEIGVGKISFFSKKNLINLIKKKSFDLTSLNAILFYFLIK